MDATSGDDRDLVERLAEEFAERDRRGERPTLDEYLERHPELSDAIRGRFPAPGPVASMPGSSLTPDASDTVVEHTDFDASGPPAPDGAPTRRLGDYRLIREVGRGGMGIVFEAEQESLGRRVALKVLPARALRDQRQVRRFEREARAAARLHHTNIVPVFGIGAQGNAHYYVMQLIRGRPLDEVLEELRALRRAGSDRRGEASSRTAMAASSTEGPTAADVAQSLLDRRDAPAATFATTDWSAIARDDEDDESVEAGDAMAPPIVASRSPAEPSSEVRPVATGGASALSDAVGGGSTHRFARGAAMLGLQVAEALDYAHREGILHRDIKPSNLLLDALGNAWVTDFGLAKAFDGDQVTRTGDIVGTLRYMAPERFDGQADRRSDIYALGLVLYELLALRPAFEASDRPHLMQLVTESRLEPLRSLDPTIPRDLALVVHKASARHPGARYQSAGELAADLRRFLDDRPVRARQVGIAERAWRWCRRNPVVAGLAAGLFLSLGLGLAGVSWKWREADAARERAARDAEEARAALDVLTGVLESPSPNTGVGVGGEVSIATFLDRSARALDAGEASYRPTTEALLRHTLGRTYTDLGESRSAATQLRRALALRREYLGPDSIEAMETEHQLLRALMYGGLEDLETIRSRREDLLGRLRSHPSLGPDHPLTSIVLSDLGNCNRLLGHPARALLQLRRAYEALIRHPEAGPDDLATTYTLGSLSIILIKQGRPEEAERLLRRSLAGRDESQRDPWTLAWARRELASALVSQGKREEAERELEEAYRRIRRLESPNSLRIFAVGEALAGLLWELGDHFDDAGRLERAHRLFEEVYEARRRLSADVSPELHRRLIESMKALAYARQRDGRLDEAGSLLERALEFERSLHGPEDRRTIHTMKQLGTVRWTQRDLRAACDLLGEALATCRSAAEPDERMARELLDLYMPVLFQRSHVHEPGAEDLALVRPEQVIDLEADLPAEGILGPAFLRLYNAELYLQRDEPKGLLAEFDELSRTFGLLLGIDDWHTLWARARAAQLRGDPEHAYALLGRLRDDRRAALGADHPITRYAEQMLAGLRPDAPDEERAVADVAPPSDDEDALQAP